MKSDMKLANNNRAKNYDDHVLKRVSEGWDGIIEKGTREYDACKRLSMMGYIFISEIHGGIFNVILTSKGKVFLQDGGFATVKRKKRARKLYRFARVVLPSIVSTVIASILVYYLTDYLDGDKSNEVTNKQLKNTIVPIQEFDDLIDTVKIISPVITNDVKTNTYNKDSIYSNIIDHDK